MGMRQAGAWLGRMIRTCLIIWAATFAAVCLWTLLWPLDRPAPQGDVIVCLAAGVDAAGTPQVGSRIRAEACAALVAAGAAPLVLFTGGAAAEGAPSSAAAMAGVAREAGLSSADILLEENAQSTLQNALFSREMLPADARLILVTEAYHLPRSWASFRALGVDVAAIHAAGRFRPDPSGSLPWRSMVRESLAIWFNAARYVVWRVSGPLGLSEATRTAILY